MTEDHERFVDVINEARERLQHAHELLYTEHGSIFTAEAGALQLRKVIELVALSSLASHRQHFEMVESEFAQNGAGRAFNLVEAINPEFWPQPIRFAGGQPTDQLFEGTQEFTAEIVDAVVLSQSEAWTTFRELSNRFLHAHNPYGPFSAGTVDLLEAGRYLAEVWFKLARLLNSFFVKLPDTDVWLLYQSRPDRGLLRFVRVRPESPP